MVMNLKKKGQAAMEFLMTYGWAILVVLAAIGALAYFGVLSPRNILPSTCTVGAGFGCNNFQATANGLQFALLNNLGNDIEEMTVTFNGDPADFQCTGLTPATGNGWTNSNCVGTGCVVGFVVGAPGVTPLRTGKTMATFSWNSCDTGPNSATRFSGNVVTDFTIRYKVAGESLFHQVQGKANLKVES
jgi:uncharacterized protein (UPF0333 family)